MDDLRHGHKQAIEKHKQFFAFLIGNLQDCGYTFQHIHYENAGLQGEIRAKDQDIATLQKHYVSYLANEDKNKDITIMRKMMKQLTISMYLYVCRMAIEDKRLVLFARNPVATVTYNFG